MKIRKVCHECGGAEIYTTQVTVKSVPPYSHIDLMPRLSNFPWCSQMDAYGCANCGHYQLHIPDKYLQRMKKRWKKY